MKKYLLAPLMGLIFVCPFSTIAGDELEHVNQAVEEKARQIDEKFGVLLTSGERVNLKIRFIVDRLVIKKESNPEFTVEALVNEAFVTYEISDPVVQRQLLIETDAAVTGGGGGSKPPCCKN